MRWYKISKGTLVYPSTLFILVQDAGVGGRDKDRLVAILCKKYPNGVLTDVEWIFTSEDLATHAIVRSKKIDKGMVVMLHIPFSQRLKRDDVNCFVVAESDVMEIERE